MQHYSRTKLNKLKKRRLCCVILAEGLNVFLCLYIFLKLNDVHKTYVFIFNT